jgi:hypothetical protein
MIPYEFGRLPVADPERPLLPADHRALLNAAHCVPADCPWLAPNDCYYLRVAGGILSERPFDERHAMQRPHCDDDTYA